MLAFLNGSPEQLGSHQLGVLLFPLWLPEAGAFACLHGNHSASRAPPHVHPRTGSNQSGASSASPPKRGALFPRPEVRVEVSSRFEVSRRSDYHPGGGERSPAGLGATSRQPPSTPPTRCPHQGHSFTLHSQCSQASSCQLWT